MKHYSFALECPQQQTLVSNNLNILRELIFNKMSSGEAFFSFHSTVTTCLSTSMLLAIAYFFSANTYDLMKQTVFEMLFNVFACFLYASSSAYMGFASNLSLYPRFISSSSDAAFPALVSVYVSR